MTNSMKILLFESPILPQGAQTSNGSGLTSSCMEISKKNLYQML